MTVFFTFAMETAHTTRNNLERVISKFLIIKKKIKQKLKLKTPRDIIVKLPSNFPQILLIETALYLYQCICIDAYKLFLAILNISSTNIVKYPIKHRSSLWKCRIVNSETVIAGKTVSPRPLLLALMQISL